MPWLVLLLSPNIASLLHDPAQQGIASPPWAVGLASIAIVLALFPRLAPGVWLLLPFAALAPLEASYILTYGHPSDAHALGILTETTPHEAQDFMAGRGLPWAVLVMASTLFSAMVARSAQRHHWRCPRRIRAWILAGGMTLLSLLIAQEQALAPVETALAHDAPSADSMILPPSSSLTADLLEESWPIGVPIRITNFMTQREGLQHATQTLRDFRFHATQVTPPTGREIHVLVIGESGRPDRWQLNGYTRSTTPRLATMENLTSFPDVTTGWAWTRMSVPVILTRKSATDARAFFPEKSLITAFREAGFRTYWYSTQSPLGTHDSSIALHAQEADEARFMNPADYKGSGAYDDALLTPLDQALARDEPRQLIVLHTLGSHYNYADRYPDAFDRFKPSLKHHPAPSMHDRTQKEAMNNSYDNSVLYTDHVLAEIIERLKNTRAVASLLYIADHGENLFDGECDKSGHGHATERDFRVASIWWHSDSYASFRQDKVRQAHSHREAPLTTSHVFHTMLDAANIRYPGEDLSRSLLSDAWLPRPRPTQAGLDFDTAPRDPACKTLTHTPTDS